MIRARRMRLSQCGGSGELLLSGLVPAGSRIGWESEDGRADV
jgi:hypothetical protein